MMFSVTIPAFKSDYLAEAVASVVGQSYADWELIVVDDCSPADLRSILSPWLDDGRVHYYRNSENCGAIDVVDNWNICLSYCRGDYVICMGDDDRLLPNCLSDLAEVINRFPGLGAYHIQTELIDAEGNVIESCPARPERESALDMLDRRWRRDSRQYIGDICLDVRRLRSAGGYYKLPIAWGSDDITFFRAAVDGIANTQRVGFLYRKTDKSLSSNEDFTVKVNAMVLASDWFGQALDAYKPVSQEERALLKGLSSRREPYFRYLCGEYVKTDIGKHPLRLIYWIRHRTDARLSLGPVCYLALKGYLRRLLHLDKR